ncbi:hypothetical protein CANARDRAFT_27030 [[Candida] arabinofermentans NRRL YB-2248]|uniref:Uncharacterized protein n=1 Tax=[Candida] arabinofermentans NRRL YB-2248 TaxID=983967 RepID=A0A1E4T4C0_9ASCO|nr:hypothetical protein CANARDRAFT_27030 [[Candida] arabinofermentans NRRL YB-2248]
MHLERRSQPLRTTLDVEHYTDPVIKNIMKIDRIINFRRVALQDYSRATGRCYCFPSTPVYI